MLERTSQLASLLPVELYQELSEYLDEIVSKFNEIGNQQQRSLNEEIRLQIEIVFFLRFLQIHFLGETHYQSLLSFFGQLQLPGFQYDTNYYGYTPTLMGNSTNYENIKQRIQLALRQLIRETNTSYLLEINDDNEIIRRILQENG